MTTQPDKPVYFMPQFMVYNGFDSSASGGCHLDLQSLCNDFSIFSPAHEVLKQMPLNPISFAKPCEYA